MRDGIFPSMATAYRRATQHSLSCTSPKQATRYSNPAECENIPVQSEMA